MINLLSDTSELGDEMNKRKFKNENCRLPHFRVKAIVCVTDETKLQNTSYEKGLPKSNITMSQQSKMPKIK
jgi:hypothetical protein